MALISMAVWDTEENQRSKYTEATLNSLYATVDWHKHRLIVVDNASCEKTKGNLEFYKTVIPKMEIIENPRNFGTAEAINEAWNHRLPGENAIKMDNDVVIYYENWIEDMEEAIKRDPKLGIVGLKRVDCWENPEHKDPFYRSTLHMLPKQPHERWMIVEKVNHVMGTCQMYSDALLQKIGYLYQPKLYGFDDSFAAVRCKLAGFESAFLPHIRIDHIDAGDTPYQKWKEAHASECWGEYHETIDAWKTGKKPIYYNPFDKTKNNESN